MHLINETNIRLFPILTELNSMNSKISSNLRSSIKRVVIIIILEKH